MYAARCSAQQPMQATGRAAGLSRLGQLLHRLARQYGMHLHCWCARSAHPAWVAYGARLPMLYSKVVQQTDVLHVLHA
jgi:hypothetical protein